MNLALFLKGIFVGIYIAAPIGPISILCIRRTMKNGYSSGVASAFGVVTAEIFYASVAIYGLTLISDFLIGYKFWLQLMGGAFLLNLGVKTFFSNPDDHSKLSKQITLFNDYLSIVFLTIANPMTIINFIAVFATFGLSQLSGDFYGATVMLLGFILGSTLCYLTLVAITNILRSKFNSKLMKMVNQVSGLTIAGFAIVILSSLIP